MTAYNLPAIRYAHAAAAMAVLFLVGSLLGGAPLALAALATAGAGIGLEFAGL